MPVFFNTTGLLNHCFSLSNVTENNTDKMEKKIL